MKTANRQIVGHASQNRSKRRTKAEIERIKSTIRDFARREKPVTVRQVFYHLTTKGLIGKTEGEYQRTVVRLMTLMRRSGDLPFSWVSDATRWMRRPTQHGSLADFMEDSARLYRRDLWDSQDAYVEVWVEKEALAGVVHQATEPWGVTLMPCKGYPSVTFVHSAAESIEEQGKPAFVYYLGDADPSGRDIPRFVESQLREFAPTADITFTLAAVTDEQIIEFDLPARPTKRTDSRAKDWDADSVELDAIPPQQLRELVNGLIVQHIDGERWNALKRIEGAERDTLRHMSQSLGEESASGDADQAFKELFGDPFGLFSQLWGDDVLGDVGEVE